MANLTKKGNTEKIDEWGHFLEYCNEQQKTRGHEKSSQAQIWIDKDLKKKLEMMKALGLEYPVRYMVNAMIKVFVEANSQEVSKYLPK